MYAFDTQSQLTMGFYIKLPISATFSVRLLTIFNAVSMTTPKNNRNCKILWISSILYTMYNNDQSSVSYWFCTGKSRDCRAYSVFAKHFRTPLVYPR